MAKRADKSKTAKADQVVVTNRRARRDYDILDTVEAGIVLRGSEVKSLREAQVQLADAYVRFDRGEAWLQGVNIAPYLHSQAHTGHLPERHRKLLLHKRQIEQLQARVDQERLSIVPLSIYFTKGRAKVELGVGRGRKLYDKREAIAARDAAREAERDLARRRY